MQRKLIRAAMLALLPAGILTGCSSGVEGPSYEKATVAPAKSAIYLYRPQDHAPSIVLTPLVPLVSARPTLPPVNCGDNSIALGPGGYHRFLVEPGPIRCSVYTEVSSSVEFEAKAGESYYVKESLHSGVARVRMVLTFTSPEDAQAEIANCKEQ
jgi:hypothetical protein